MKLKDLVGNKKLDAVEVQSMAGFYGDCNLIKFRLDGIVYCAMEDVEDGYRSSMGYITVLDSDDVKNIFPAIDVICTYNGEYDSDLLVIYDAETRWVVLEVGTDRADYYYPFFVASFFPEAMITNKKR